VPKSSSATGSAPQSGNLTLNLSGATSSVLAYSLQGEPTTLGIINVSNCQNCGGGFGGGTPTHDFGTVAAGTTAFNYFFVQNSGATSALARANSIGTQGITNFAVGRTNADLGYGATRLAP
jgi:hypothetical protein